jgi:hypothetical protein
MSFSCGLKVCASRRGTLRTWVADERAQRRPRQVIGRRRGKRCDERPRLRVDAIACHTVRPVTDQGHDRGEQRSTARSSLLVVALKGSTMNTLRLTAVASTLSLAVLGALLTPAAQAQSLSAAQRIEITGASSTPGWVREGDTLVPHVPFFGLRTRAEVIAEMKAWQAAGETVFAGDTLVRRDNFVSTKTRAEVMAEATASRARGDFIRVGDETLPRHVAEEMGAIARSPAAKVQNVAATSLGNVR